MKEIRSFPSLLNQLWIAAASPAWPPKREGNEGTQLDMGLPEAPQSSGCLQPGLALDQRQNTRGTQPIPSSVLVSPKPEHQLQDAQQDIQVIPKEQLQSTLKLVGTKSCRFWCGSPAEKSIKNKHQVCPINLSLQNPGEGGDQTENNRFDPTAWIRSSAKLCIHQPSTEDTRNSLISTPRFPVGLPYRSSSIPQLANELRDHQAPS